MKDLKNVVHSRFPSSLASLIAFKASQSYRLSTDGCQRILLRRSVLQDRIDNGGDKKIKGAMTSMTYRKFLAEELERRLAKNPLYSLRAFARDLGISKTHLAEILRGNNQLSLDSAAKFVKKLNLSAVDAINFMDMVEIESGNSERTRLQAKMRLEARHINFRNLEPEEFSPISDWHFMPLMELLTLPLESHSPEYLASRLGVSKEIIEQALQTLLRQNLISQVDSKYVITENTTKPVASHIIRQYYRTNLDVAAQALEKQSIDNRDFSVITFTMSKRKLDLVKERLQQFRRELALELTQDQERDAVYTLSMNFFEATLAKVTT